MIVYTSTKEGFQNDIDTNNIGSIIFDKYFAVTGGRVGDSELNSWTNSLQYMSRALNHRDIPDDVGVSIEYHIPGTTKRIDFIVTGLNEQNEESVVIVELKQWQEAQLTAKDGIVKTRFKYGETETAHPSYQAWSYKCLLEDYNETVEQDAIGLHPCAYLHNYNPDEVIRSSFYEPYITDAPIFLKPDAQKLREFIKSHIKYGDTKNILYRIENGKIRPSKNLADKLTSLLKGNREFVMIDDQKVVFETALALAKESSEINKNVLIVQGGPGTGKTVVAMNLLSEFLQGELNAQYVSRNSAPRKVYATKLKGSFKQSNIDNLFSGSGSFHSTPANTFGALIVDEAHRLTKKSGMFNHLGENQIKEIINAAEFTVLFVDEDQKVTFHDIGDIEEMRKHARDLGVTVREMKLESQFRCDGSDGYIAWLDRVLQIHDTANLDLGPGYNIQVLDSPKEMHERIIEENKKNNKARVVAGYCWKWVSKKSPDLDDIVIGDYSAKWNLDSDGQEWIIQKNSVTEVGCIHTCQGLEVDHIGVIIGPDLIVRNGKVITVPEARASSDKSIQGWKKMLKEQGEESTRAKLDAIIKNTYRTLLTRGMKGGYIYCTDPETQEYFKNAIKNGTK